MCEATTMMRTFPPDRFGEAPDIERRLARLIVSPELLVDLAKSAHWITLRVTPPVERPGGYEKRAAETR